MEGFSILKILPPFWQSRWNIKGSSSNLSVIYVELTKFYTVHIFLGNVVQQGRKIFTGVTNFSWLRFFTFLLYLTWFFIYYFINICLIFNVIVSTKFRIFNVSIFNIIFTINIVISKLITRTFNIFGTEINIIVRLLFLHWNHLLPHHNNQKLVKTLNIYKLCLKSKCYDGNWNGVWTDLHDPLDVYCYV